MGELGLAAEYTLTNGAINQVLGGVSAIARSPFALGRMSLGVADRAKEIGESAAALGVLAGEYQALRYSFAGKGLGQDCVEPMVQMAKPRAWPVSNSCRASGRRMPWASFKERSPATPVMA